MKLKKFVIVLFTALMAIGMTVGCERKDVQEEMDGDDVGVIDGEEEFDVISPDPEEATDELPGVEPGQVPDASLKE